MDKSIEHAATERYAQGVAAYASQLNISLEEVPAWFAKHHGDRFAEEAINATGGAWPDDCLTLRDRSLIVVASLITQGCVDTRLRGHTRWAVEHGATAEELGALVTLLAVFIGYPKASIANEIIRDELARMQEKNS